MFIKKIYMNEYKRFHELTIDLGDNPKRIVALVGPNGCGKSCVFDAMLYLTNNYSHIGSSNNKDYRYHSLQQNPGYSSSNIKIEFDIGNYIQVYNQKRAQGSQNTIFSFRSSFRYNSELKVRNVVSINDISENTYGASTTSDLDQRIEQNYRRLLAKYNRYRDENDLRPSEAINYIIGKLNDSLTSCLDLTICNIGNVDDDKGTMFFKKSDSDIQFEYNVLSAGEKEVIDILLDLYLRSDTYKDSIYIIDEPELHLNTSIQKNLLKEINQIIPENCQIWIATHSIGFLRILQDEFNSISQILKFDSTNQWASETYVLKPSVMSHNEWKDLFSVALEDLSELICPKIIIYCEGKDKPGINKQEKGFDAKVYNCIFSKEFPDVLFVSSGGNTELDQRSEIAFAVLSKVFSKLCILVLKDMDMASGKKVDEKSRDEYLKHNPLNHRVLKRFEIENYLFDKEVLIKYCNLNNKTFNSELYDSYVSDVKTDNLKDITLKIMECCSISENIGKESFKLELSELIVPGMNVYNELKSVIFDGVL